jgi:hypothetical protein
LELVVDGGVGEVHGAVVGDVEVVREDDRLPAGARGQGGHVAVGRDRHQPHAGDGDEQLLALAVEGEAERPALRAGEDLDGGVGRPFVDGLRGPVDGAVLAAGVEATLAVEGNVLGAISGEHAVAARERTVRRERARHRGRVGRVPLGGIEPGATRGADADGRPEQEAAGRDRVATHGSEYHARA